MFATSARSALSLSLEAHCDQHQEPALVMAFGAKILATLAPTLIFVRRSINSDARSFRIKLYSSKDLAGVIEALL
jgi:hypothetical protein